MADKKLNDLTTASDGAYVYAEDASGNQIKISKADLASVVAGVIGLVGESKSGLLPAGVLFKKTFGLIAASGSVDVNFTGGLFMFRCTYHHGKFSLYYVDGGSIIDVAKTYDYNNGDAFTFSHANNVLTITNASSTVGKSAELILFQLRSI